MVLTDPVATATEASPFEGGDAEEGADSAGVDMPGVSVRLELGGGLYGLGLRRLCVRVTGCLEAWSAMEEDGAMIELEAEARKGFVRPGGCVKGLSPPVM